MRLIVIFTFLQITSISLSQDYIYHLCTSKAEELIVKDSLDKANEYYNKAFSLNQFPFEKDLRNALIINLKTNNFESSSFLIEKLIIKGYDIKSFNEIPYINKINKDEKYLNTINKYDSLMNIRIKLLDSIYLNELINIRGRDQRLTLNYRNKTNLTEIEEKELRIQDSLNYFNFVSLVKEKGWPSEEMIGYQWQKQTIYRTLLFHSFDYPFYDSSIIYNAYKENKIPSYILTYYEENRIDRLSHRKFNKMNLFEYNYQPSIFYHYISSKETKHQALEISCEKLKNLINYNRTKFGLSTLENYLKIINFSNKNKYFKFYPGFFNPNSSDFNETKESKFRYETLNICGN